ncbi:MAG: hypothetical protein U1E00_07955 [Pseudoxanthomonas sp.]|jgi:hypothetical protein|uniref:Uncharacterized protein n=1 Tax=Pseudoxanthomonas mexicana TaxID=128785 RepID=A0A7G9TCR0_PSEMX|nr:MULTISPECIES: hypothetical protein [Pseudoxanthomonas]MCH2089965.1 hypothetical protein [Pseudoxanthomonas sp.]MDZ4048248.1 hypothetical protein [Pseudoxanthomonas sp.]QNN77885.1 hypothetical protein IAE60_00095 [Pseudoxanthomonas mexicana]UOV02657.1 hypothetical protein MUU73_05290 [Pseudoxanthomonas mexicana]HMM25065.1 hypothetical protein [Pseudoxanthomonas mexicana]
MNRISRMVVRMYVPAAVIAASGFATAEAVTRTGRSFGDVTPQRLASLAFLLAILLGTAWALHSTWRLYRWARGRELRCACGGMMSRVRYNRQRQKYRKCLACGGKTLEGAHCGGT